MKRMKKVLITGATSGIGRSLALKYLQAGNIVGITGRRAELLEEIKSQYPERTFVSAFDVTDRVACEKSIDGLCEAMGGVDLFIYNSGYGKSTKDLDPEIESRTVDVNVSGFVTAVNHMFCYFVKNGIRGHIAATSSVASTKGLGAAPAYSATKKFIAVYMEALEQKSAMIGAGLKFTTIKPGFIDTDFIKGDSYPLTMDKEYAVRRIYREIERGKRVKIIDWRWSVVVSLWRLIPRWLWVRLRIS